MYTVKQLSKMAGVTPRTLHYYDQIGLLKPSRVAENGYRYYGEEALLRLQQILLYRELDLPLKRIQRILAGRDFDVLEALVGHRQELRRRIAQLERLVKTVDHTIDHVKGQKTMSQKQFFEGFSAEQEAAYEKEAMQMYDPETVKTSYKKWRGYTAEQKQRIGEEGNAVYAAFLQAIPQGPGSAAAQECVQRWRQHMNYFWTPSPEQLLGIAGGYVNDPRFRANFDRIDPRLAEFVHEAVSIYVQGLQG